MQASSHVVNIRLIQGTVNVYYTWNPGFLQSKKSSPRTDCFPERASAFDTALDHALFHLVLEERERDDNGGDSGDDHRELDQVTAVVGIGGIQEVSPGCSEQNPGSQINRGDGSLIDLRSIAGTVL